MDTTLNAASRLSLQNSTSSIPCIGFGSYKIRGQTCATAVLAALSAGYRHIDSAALYRNEVRVREAIEQSKVVREDLFITTKVGSPRRKTEGTEVYEDVVETVERIAGKDGYVDLLLMHVPGPSREHRQNLWEAMERVKREGRAKNIGVSNFRVRHLDEMKEYATEWPPSVNQIEVSHCILPTDERTI
jgi:diketogulonate reductase-like aldo/keto reductase